MKFKIVEGYLPMTQEISMDFIKSKGWLERDYNEAVDAAPIYRGIGRGNYSGPIIVIPDPEQQRMSANTKNFYTLVINNHPAWKDFPKRTIIGTTSLGRAQAYSHGRHDNMYRVYPKNGAKIGIVNAADIWDANDEEFLTGVKKIEIIYDLLFKKFNLEIPYDNPENYSQLQKQCQMVDRYKRKLTTMTVDDIVQKIGNWDSPEIYNIFQTWKKSNKSILDTMVDIYWLPDKDFKWTYIKDFNTKGNHEVWTDAKCLMIPVSKEEWDRGFREAERGWGA